MVLKTLLVDGWSTFFIKGRPVFSNGPQILPKSPPDCFVWLNWVFDISILPGELFAKSLQSLKTCVWVNDHWSRKLYSSLKLPITSDGKV